MELDEFLDLLRKRRSIRRFKSEPIPDEYIVKILEAGRWAMSGANAQPWEFVVVKDPLLRGQIIESHFESHNESYAVEQTRVMELRLPALRDDRWAPVFKDAPVFIIVLGDRRTYQSTVLTSHFVTGEGGGEGGADATYLKNMANAVQNMHLAAYVLGIGSLWVSVNHVWEQRIKTLLDIPEVLDVHSIVALGYAAYRPAAAYRREMEAIVHQGKYEASKYRSAREIYEYLYNLRCHTAPAYLQLGNDLK